MRVLFAMMLVGGSMCAFASDAPQPEPKPRPKLEPVGPDWFPCDFCGRVVACTGKDLAIKPERGLTILEIKPLPDGTTRERIYVQDNTKPPRPFVFSDALFPDRPGSKSPRHGEHEVADVRVGDFVWIGCRQMKGAECCVSIQIQRRPGGKVPPAIGDDKRPKEKRIDVGYNRVQFVEEKVVPAFLSKLPRMVPPLRP